MKKIVIFIAGFFVGLTVCFIVLYGSGVIFEYMGIQFYSSESDQQRNFNIFLVISAIVSFLTGLFFVKKLPNKRH